MTSTAPPPAGIPEATPVELTLEGHADRQTTTSGVRTVGTTIDGVEVVRARCHVDPRGMLAEVINFDDPFWREPIVYAYAMSVNPGRIKGWAVHRLQVDRHFVHTGSVRFALYDARVGSPTHGVVATIDFTDENRGAVRIPAGVWHAAQGWGDEPAFVTNFPTRPYNHQSPDKETLPARTPLIPYDFDDLDDYRR